MDGPTPVAIRLRRSIPEHDAYTVYLADHRFAVLATARPADARRWVAKTRWLHSLLLHRGCLVVGLGVQWTPPRRPLYGAPPVPATLQLCVGHRCLVFHLAQADAVPEALRRFLADRRVTFVGSGSADDRRMLQVHYGLRVARGLELRAVAGMGNASMEEMADRILGYPGITKPVQVSMSVWHAPRLSMDQVLYAAVDAFLAFRLGVRLQPRVERRAPPLPRGPVPARRPVVLNCPLPPGPRGPVVIRPAPPARRAPVYVPVRQAPPAVGAINHAATAMSLPAFCPVAIPEPADEDDASYVRAASHEGLPVRAYASDSDDGYSSDGFQHVRFGAFTDDEEEDGSVTDLDINEDEDAVCSGLGTLSVDEDEYAQIGILTVEDSNRDDDEFTAGDRGVVTANVDEECGGDDCAFEEYYLGHSEAVMNNGEEDALRQDDWNDQEDYGIYDLDDEELYLL